MSTEKSIVTVWLESHNDTEQRPYFCPNCRNIVMEYVGEVVKSAPGLAPRAYYEAGWIIQCSNKNCRTRYKFIMSASH